MAIKVETMVAAKILNEATAFYDACDRKTLVDAKDTLMVAYDGSKIVGIARLCSEVDSYTLRTVQVDYDHQKQGIGQMLLNKFVEVVKERGIGTVYSMPYDHLEAFYGSVGFKKIDPKEAPGFLQTRFKYFHSRNAGKQAILMARK